MRSIVYISSWAAFVFVCSLIDLSFNVFYTIVLLTIPVIFAPVVFWTTLVSIVIGMFLTCGHYVLLDDELSAGCVDMLEFLRGVYFVIFFSSLSGLEITCRVFMCIMKFVFPCKYKKRID